MCECICWLVCCKTMSMTKTRPVSTLIAECNRPDACAAGNASAEPAIPSHKECDAFIEVAAASQKAQHLPTCSCVMLPVNKTNAAHDLAFTPISSQSLLQRWSSCSALQLSLIDSYACPCSAKAGASQRFEWACHQQRAQGAVLLSAWGWSQALDC